MRHRPRFRKGRDRLEMRKGNIAGGPNKKKKNKTKDKEGADNAMSDAGERSASPSIAQHHQSLIRMLMMSVMVSLALSVLALIYRKFYKLS